MRPRIVNPKPPKTLPKPKPKRSDLPKVSYLNLGNSPLLTCCANDMFRKNIC